MTYTNNYTAPTWRQIANAKRSLSEKLADNAELLEDEFDAIEAAIPDVSGIETAVGKAAINTAILGIKPVVVDPTEVGYDFADGTGGVIHGALVAPADITLVSAKLYVTELYAKNTDDAVVTIQDNALVPNEFASLTFDGDGYAVGDVIDLVISEDEIPALTMLNVNVVSTANTGTGHGLIVLEYTRD